MNQPLNPGEQRTWTIKLVAQHDEDGALLIGLEPSATIPHDVTWFAAASMLAIAAEMSGRPFEEAVDAMARMVREQGPGNKLPRPELN